ncbi:MAG: hypothetical protein HOW73_15980 [Polyangiaceae bacterium]|nr:hypothetical protein [Polyangiaceae bacterium]
MSGRSRAVLVVLCALLASVGLWLRYSGVLNPPPEAPIVQPDDELPLPGIPLDDGHSVGPGVSVGNLTVFPVYAKTPEDVGEFMTLAKAIEESKAEVREVGEGGTVNTLVIENKSTDASILILAGTIVKGGKQDRQIGEDVVVAPGQTTNVAAFCVEQGRWNGQREGTATNGKFEAKEMLAVGKVRAAGQYEKDQSQVWSNVSKVNEANMKAAPSQTLLASLDDAALGKERERIVEDAAAAFEKVEQPGRVVGLAYAVGGEVKGARWFAGRKLFALHRPTLLNTAAMEAITARAQVRPDAERAPVAEAKAEAVVAFVRSMDATKVAEERTRETELKAYRVAPEGYASEVWLPAPKTPAGGPPSPTGTAAPSSSAFVTKDFFKK